MDAFVDRFVHDMSSISAASSPDPLNASLEGNSAVPSSRRVTRSQTLRSSSRLSSVNPSPRKQIFSLDVGNESAPQKILVTVEADDTDVRGGTVNRRLFQTGQSPTPKKPIRTRGGTVTKTVPLRGLTDDEGAPEPTPKRRGRPPKSANGTPAPSAKKRAAPIRKTPARPRRTKMDQTELTSDVTVEDNDPTPRANTKTRGTARKRKADSPAAEPSETPAIKRRVRQERSVTADSIEAQRTEADNAGVDARTDDNASVAPSDNSSAAGGYAPMAPSDKGDDDEEDIWMATLSDPPARFSRRKSPTPTQQEEQPIFEAEEYQDPPTPDAGRRTETEEPVSEANVEYGAAAAHSEADFLTSDAHDHSGDKDTIMVQEEFTMISIHSLPSMQASMSMSVAATHEDIGDETSMIINGALESYRQSQNQARHEEPEEAEEEGEDEVSFVGDQQTSPVEEKPTPRNNSLLSAPSPSSTWVRSPRRVKKPEDLGRQLALKSLQKEPTSHPSQAQPVEEPSTYDDSFSEIPDAVLEAATPKPFRRALIEEQDDNELDQAIQMSIERHSRVNSPNQNPESNNLITPDETPSPDTSDDSGEKMVESVSKAEETEHEEMASSPPVLNFSNAEQHPPLSRHSRQESSDTPAIQAPATQLPPKIGDVENQGISLAPPETASRQSFSPIVRAGRALQRVTSDPPSPPVRDNALGSPFRSSTSKSPTTVTQPTVTQQMNTQEATRQLSVAQPPATAFSTHQSPVVEQPARNSPWSSAFAPFKQIKNVVAQAAQRFSPRAAPPPAPPATHDMSDPFVAAPEPGRRADWERQDTLSMHNSMFSLGNGSASRPEHNASRTSSIQADGGMDDEMSWVADGTPVRMDQEPDSVSSTMRANQGSIGGHDMSDMDVDIQSFVEPQEEEEHEQEDEQPDYNDADLWDFEASRPTPRKPEPRATAIQEPVLDPPRRSKIPSPWRQNSKRLVYNDERRRAAENIISKEAEADEFSLLSQFGGGASAGPKGKEVEQAPAQPAKKGMDLSSFFSSPALLPEVRPPFAFGSSKPAERRPAPATEETETQPAQLPVSRRIFSFGSGRSKGSQLVSSVASSRPTIPQKNLQIGGNQPRRDLFSPIKRTVTRFEVPDSEAAQQSSSPATQPRQQSLPVVPQKANFAPRSVAAGNSLFNASLQPGSLFSKPAAAFAEPGSEGGVTTPERQTSPAGSNIVVSNPKHLPDPQRSPTKSSFRSPLKAKTPGRVVVFASSTLSPLAQAQARAERRASLSASPEKSSAAPPARSVDFDKENQALPNNDIDMAKGGFNTARTTTTTTTQGKPKPTFSLFGNTTIPHLPPPTSSTSTTLKPPPTRLSPTTWSRAHWERLDSLLQQRRRTGALNFQLAHPLPKARNRNHRPRLIGKQVVAQGETMTLEQWHLDVVDAFAAELGSEECAWDEKVLAKRVFALLVGEERRRAAKVPQRRGAGEGVLL